MKPFEREAVRLMADGHIQTDLLTRVYEAAEASFEHTGLGYFLSVHDDELPVERSVFHSPIVLGRAGDIEVGFIVFVGERELTLECHSWGDGLPEDVRERDFAVSVQSKPQDDV